MEPEHVTSEVPEQMSLEQVAHLDELGEDESPVAFRYGFFEHLGEPGQLAGASWKRRAVGQEVRRVVAHLLELQHGGEHEAPALDALGLLDPRSMSSTTAW